MIRDPPSQGNIVAYPYLWRRQHEAGETEGRKTRPVCLVLAVRDEARGLTHLAFLAITSQPPTAGKQRDPSDSYTRRVRPLAHA